MATYAELHGLTTNVALLNKVMIAVAVAAEVIRTEDSATPDHARREAWAKAALANVDGTARQLMWALMAQNASAPATNIENAGDVAIQTAVESALELML